MAEPGALINLDDELILQRIAQGQYAAHIAKELGVSHQALYQRLAKNPRYQLTREIGTDVRLAKLEQDIAQIPDDAAPLALARARELLSHARWRAEREFPHRWGAKQQLDLQGNISVTIARGVVIEGAAAQQIEDVTPHNPESEG